MKNVGYFKISVVAENFEASLFEMNSNFPILIIAGRLAIPRRIFTLPTGLLSSIVGPGKSAVLQLYFKVHRFSISNLVFTKWS